jgi:hypothetical protein
VLSAWGEAGLTGSLCTAFPGPPPGDYATLLHEVEAHGRLASLCLDDVSAEDLLHAADQALSAAKERGGAAVVSAGRVRAYAAQGR